MKMKKSELRDLYSMMFPEYQDIVNITQLQSMLCISRHLAYELINDGYIKALKIGNAFRIPNELGDRMRPNYLTEYFPKFIEKHGLPRMRFHDLRHSCASLLLANGVPLKQIQEWLGHSDFSTTANIYAHLDYKSKISSAQAMEKGMILPGADDFGSRWNEVTE